jgi:hypothetical protein
VAMFVAWAVLASTKQGPSAAFDRAGETASGGTVTIESPDRNVRVVFGLYQTSRQRGVAAYDVLWRGRTLVQRARLGIDLLNTGPFGANLRVVSVK